MPSRPCLPACASGGSSASDARGFSVVELLVSLTVGSLLMGAALTITMSSRRGMSADQNRTHVNQNLRSSLDLIGIEIRQAGERLPNDVPALEIVDGASGAPDELILRRNLLDDVLPLCADLTGGSLSTEIQVADATSPPPGCALLDDDDSNGFPDNIDVWRNFRDGNGGAVLGYVYNPIDKLGEYFLYNGDGTTNEFLAKGNSDTWARDYEVAEGCRLYILEEKRYELASGVLKYAINENTGSAIHMSSDISDFQLTALLNNGTTLSSLTNVDEWTDLLAIDVSVTGEVSDGHHTTQRTVSARFFPRNILSN